MRLNINRGQSRCSGPLVVGVPSFRGANQTAWRLAVCSSCEMVQKQNPIAGPEAPRGPECQKYNHIDTERPRPAGCHDRPGGWLAPLCSWRPDGIWGGGIIGDRTPRPGHLDDGRQRPGSAANRGQGREGRHQRPP